MVKVLCVLCIVAWTSLATAMPQSGGQRVDTNSIVDTVISQLDLDQAIAAALRGLSGSGDKPFIGVSSPLPGQCPAPTRGPACGGAVSNCWSPGQRDTDCPSNGLCCFDGCADTCVDLPRPQSEAQLGPSSSPILGPSTSLFLGPSTSFTLGTSSSPVPGPSASPILEPSTSLTIGQATGPIIRPLTSPVVADEEEEEDDDKSAVIDQVLSTLSPQIENAVSEALSAFTSSSQTGFETSNQQSTSSSGSTQIQGSTGQDQSALVTQIITVLAPSITQSVQAALSEESSSSQSTFATSNQQATSSSGSTQLNGSIRQDQSALVTQIISILTPSITQSVQSALSEQSSTAGQQSFTSSGLTSGFQQTVSTQKVDQNALVQQVLAALGPTITAQVQAAVASTASSSSSSQQSNNQAFQQVQSVQSSEQRITRLVQQIITTLTPVIRSSVRAALRGQTQAVTTVSTQAAVDQRALIARIISILQPNISTLVLDAISSQPRRSSLFNISK